MKKIDGERFRVAIYGYGNLGKGVEAAVMRAADLELGGVFTHRPDQVRTQALSAVYPADAFASHAAEFDAVLLCAGSERDLPRLTPALSSVCNTIDSFDTHATAQVHFGAVNAAAQASGHLSLIGAGWDPGVFSVMRLLGEAVLPDGEGATFWGRGISQGHSEAVRRVPGVLDARAETVPDPQALADAKAGERCYAQHRRICSVVAAPDADRARIAAQIRAIPHYFAGQQTEVRFVTPEQLPQGYPHGGYVFRNGTAGGFGQQLFCRLRLGDNPAFTGSVMTAFARAVCRMHRRGRTGCLLPFDIAPVDLVPFPSDAVWRCY